MQPHQMAQGALTRKVYKLEIVEAARRQGIIKLLHDLHVCTPDRPQHGL
jgi:hypothetical protein